MEIVSICPKCDVRHREYIPVPETVAEERKRIATLLADNPRGFGGGLLSRDDMRAFLNGYCTRHDPEKIAAAVAAESQCEIVKQMREINRKEEAAVGLFMRLRQPENFSVILAGLRDIEKLSDEMRGSKIW